MLTGCGPCPQSCRGASARVPGVSPGTNEAQMPERATQRNRKLVLASLLLSEVHRRGVKVIRADPSAALGLASPVPAARPGGRRKAPSHLVAVVSVPGWPHP